MAHGISEIRIFEEIKESTLPKVRQSGVANQLLKWMEFSMIWWYGSSHSGN
jgi:hypothetical protein